MKKVAWSKEVKAESISDISNLILSPIVNAGAESLIFLLHKEKPSSH